MSRRTRVIVSMSGIAFLAALVIVGRPRISRDAFQLFADTCTACGEFHDHVTGFIILNPLRNRAPESVAARFLSDLQKGKCDPTLPSIICLQGLVNSRPVLDWKLRNRRDSKASVSLFYLIKGKYRSGVDIYPQDAWGEGIVEVKPAGSDWRISGYGSYY